MARETGEVVLDDGQQALFDEMSMVIESGDDDIVLMARTQDLINMLLRRSEDAALRDRTLGEVSRFFLGLMKAPDLSAEYRGRKLRMFAKATLRILIAKRPMVAAEIAGAAPPLPPGRRAADGIGIGIGAPA